MSAFTRKDFEDLIEQWTTPIWFNSGPNERPENVRDNGSAGLVRSADSRFILTARHVLEEFRALKRNNPETLLTVYIGDRNAVGIVNPQVIAESAQLDLATIEFPYLDSERGNIRKTYFPLDQFPVRRAAEGEPATIVGFSGFGRSGGPLIGSYEPFPIGMLVSRVNDRYVTLNENEPIRFIRHGQILENGLPLGGFSGSPAFGFTLEGHLYLIGAVSRGTDRLGCSGTRGSVFLGSAEYLMPDGTFDVLRMPPE